MSYAQLQSPGRIDYIQCNYPTSNRSTPLFGYYSSLCLPRRIMYGFLFFLSTASLDISLSLVSCTSSSAVTPGAGCSPRAVGYICPAPKTSNHTWASAITHFHPRGATNTFYRIIINSHSASSRANGLMSIFLPSPKRVASLSPPPQQMRKYYHRQRLL